jgi:DNA-directed RNA polymerase specialized sigma24 family protein
MILPTGGTYSLLIDTSRLTAFTRAVNADERKARLLAIAQRFSIGQEEAEALADDALCSFLMIDANARVEECLDGHMARICRRRYAAAVMAGLDPVALREILPALPAHTRRVLLLHAFEGLDAHGVAALLNVSPTYAAVLIARSVERAKQAILERQQR